MEAYSQDFSRAIAFWLFWVSTRALSVGGSRVITFMSFNFFRSYVVRSFLRVNLASLVPCWTTIFFAETMPFLAFETIAAPLTTA